MHVDDPVALTALPDLPKQASTVYALTRLSSQVGQDWTLSTWHLVISILRIEEAAVVTGNYAVECLSSAAWKEIRANETQPFIPKLWFIFVSYCPRLLIFYLPLSYESHIEK